MLRDLVEYQNLLIDMDTNFVSNGLIFFSEFFVKGEMCGVIII